MAIVLEVCNYWGKIVIRIFIYKRKIYRRKWILRLVQKLEHMSIEIGCWQTSIVFPFSNKEGIAVERKAVCSICGFASCSPVRSVFARRDRSVKSEL